MLTKTESQPILASSGSEVIEYNRPSKVRFVVALGIAAVSDLASLWTEFVPPVQWVVDLVTAGLLFLVLGRRWALLPGLLLEAIPGKGVVPFWVLVVISLFVYDEIKIHRPTKHPALRQ